MKKSLLALAALTAFAGAASAQSSVTLFGIVDLALRNQDNGAGSQQSLASAGINTSRLGFRGVEDLGGGLRAGFWLEGQLNPDNGTAQGQTWQRRSTVSLIGGFGEIRLGRDYKPTFWNTTTFDPFGTNGVGSENNVLPTLGNAPYYNLVRADNTVGYFLPSLGGVYGQLQVAAGEGSTQKYYGGRIGYAAGPVNVAASYGRNAKNSGSAANRPLDDYDVWNVGGSFNAGFATFALLYNKHEYGNYDLKSYMAAATVPFGASSLKFSYNHSNIGVGAVNAIQNRTAKQYAIGYQYDLSKRTAVYATYAQLKNDTGLRLTTSTDAPISANSGFNSKGYEFGMRHSF
ncbi:MAG: porin [Pseudomonadota bacterium]|nr:porin [Pseudomonadota bacterium]